MPDTEVLDGTDTTTKTKLRPPSRFNVVLFNDDRTTVEFVILVLMSIFHKSFETAHALTLQIHNQGKGIAGTYSHEVATQKRDETLMAAQANHFPLRCEIEEA